MSGQAYDFRLSTFVMKQIELKNISLKKAFIVITSIKFSSPK